MNFKSSILSLLTALALVPAAALELPRTNEVSLERPLDTSAELTLVNFWATWCVPCVKELDDLKDLDEKYDDQTLTIVGISLDAALPIDEDEAARRAVRMIRDKEIRYPNFLFTGAQAELARKWDIDSGLPFSLLIDREGRIVEAHRGRIDPKQIVQEIEKHLDRPRSD